MGRLGGGVGGSQSHRPTWGGGVGGSLMGRLGGGGRG